MFLRNVFCLVNNYHCPPKPPNPYPPAQSIVFPVTSVLEITTVSLFAKGRMEGIIDFF